MTHQEKLEAIRQKCIEANPEIVELKFGCEVEYRNSEFRIMATDEEYENPHMPGCLFVPIAHPNNIPDEKGNPEIRTLNILGRPIRLADVLLACGDATAVVGSGDGMGCFLEWKNRLSVPRGYWWNEHNILWNLREDDLTKQSPETIDFIHQLLYP